MSDARLDLSAGLDRSIAWYRGGSVRYLVADLAAGGAPAGRAAPPLNIALCIDVSGSMGGDKIAAAREAALAVAASLTARDRLSVVAFANRAEALLDARAMDAEGQAAAAVAIHRLQAHGGTNLFEGWLQAAERVASAAALAPGATPRVLILSDGHANQGLVNPVEIAVHVGALLERGVLTSTLGIGDGYDENLLGTIAAAGGGNLHDAAGGGEITEVVLGELREGRAALLERVTLRVVVPEGLRAEVVGAWASAPGPAGLEVTVGSLLPEQTRRVVVRLHCPAGDAGTPFVLAVSAHGQRPDGQGVIELPPTQVVLHLGDGGANKAQPRDRERTLAVVNAWQADVVRAAVAMNRDGDYRAARSFIERELRLLERYARGIPGTEAMLRDLALVQRNVHEAWDERTRKEVYSMSSKASRMEDSFVSAERETLFQRFSRPAKRT